MALIDLWTTSQDQLKDKHVQQMIAFAGDGRLLDESSASKEFRGFLSQIPSSVIFRYASECLTEPFADSGLALQDIVNQIGRRLGFEVTDGRYRGSTIHVGFDGLWRSPNGHTLIVEVKTTDAYRIKLDRLISYRKALNSDAAKSDEGISFLIIVGREDTGDLEAQIRGSRWAWDIRLSSIDALLRLVTLKETVEDPVTLGRIHSILAPREFTRLDEIVDILFSTAEDIKQDDEIPEEDEDKDLSTRKPKVVPVAFHDACVARIGKHFSQVLLKRSRAAFSSADGSLSVVCAVSKEHSGHGQGSYWFAFHPHQKDWLESAQHAYVALGCGTEANLVLIPFADFAPWLPGMNTTQRDDRSYWHISVYRENSKLIMRRKRGETRIDVTPYLLSA